MMLDNTEWADYKDWVDNKLATDVRYKGRLKIDH